MRKYENLILSSANSAANSAANLVTSQIIATAQGKLANGGRDKGCKFYYDKDSGGSLLVVAAKSILGGAVPVITSIAVNAFNGFINGKPAEKTVIKKEGWSGNAEKAQNELKTYGVMTIKDVANNDASVYALDDWGCVSPDAVMLGIETDNNIDVKQTFRLYDNTIDSLGVGVKNIVGSSVQTDFKTKTLVWYDVTALVSLSSDKNLVVTKVQGRDYSRKELVSNGDVKFSVTGQITGRMPEVYPEDEVKKFIKIMNYKGIVRIHNQVLDQLGITHIVITDFSLSPKQGFKNTQPYSFSALGLQPEKTNEITEDTVIFETSTDTVTKKTEENRWKQLLDSHLDVLKSHAPVALENGINIGIDQLTHGLT